MIGRGVSDFITTLVMHFPVRHESEAREAEWLRGMANALRGYEASVLTRAAQTLIETRKDRRFPLPAECRDACAKALADERRERPMLLAMEQGVLPIWHPSREKLAYELILGEMGKRAAKENWIAMLFTFTRDNMRLPQTDAEIKHLIRESRLAGKDYEKLLRDDYDIHPAKTLEWAKLRGEFIKGWEMRFARREALARYVETGVLP